MITEKEAYFYAVDGLRYGPVTLAEIRQAAVRGELKRTHKIWRPGMPTWHNADTFTEVFDGLPPDMLDDPFSPPPLEKEIHRDSGPAKMPGTPTFSGVPFSGEPKRFKIYQGPLGVYQVIKQGWSWPAFFFTWIWAFAKQLYPIGWGGFACAAILGIFSGSGTSEGEVAGFGFGFVMMVSFALRGNSWLERDLMRRSFQLKGEYIAETSEAAMIEYSKSQRASPQSQ